MLPVARMEDRMLQVYRGVFDDLMDGRMVFFLLFFRFLSAWVMIMPSDL